MYHHQLKISTWNTEPPGERYVAPNGTWKIRLVGSWLYEKVSLKNGCPTKNARNSFCCCILSPRRYKLERNLGCSKACLKKQSGPKYWYPLSPKQFSTDHFLIIGWIHWFGIKFPSLYFNVLQCFDPKKRVVLVVEASTHHVWSVPRSKGWAHDFCKRHSVTPGPFISKNSLSSKLHGSQILHHMNWVQSANDANDWLWHLTTTWNQ